MLRNKQKSNLSLLITVVCRLLFLTSGVFFLSILQWETEVMEKRSNLSRITQQVTDREETEPKSQAAFRELGWQALQLSSKALTEFG